MLVLQQAQWVCMASMETLLRLSQGSLLLAWRGLQSTCNLFSYPMARSRVVLYICNHFDNLKPGVFHLLLKRFMPRKQVCSNTIAFFTPKAVLLLSTTHASGILQQATTASTSEGKPHLATGSMPAVGWPQQKLSRSVNCGGVPHRTAKTTAGQSTHS